MVLLALNVLQTSTILQMVMLQLVTLFLVVCCARTNKTVLVVLKIIFLRRDCEVCSFFIAKCTVCKSEKECQQCQDGFYVDPDGFCSSC